MSPLLLKYVEVTTFKNETGTKNYFISVATKSFSNYMKCMLLQNRVLFSQVFELTSVFRSLFWEQNATQGVTRFTAYNRNGVYFKNVEYGDNTRMNPDDDDDDEDYDGCCCCCCFYLTTKLLWGTTCFPWSSSCIRPFHFDKWFFLYPFKCHC